jgi:hypothetical protein
MPDLPLRYEVFDRSGDLLHRNIGIDALLIEEINPVRP